MADKQTPKGDEIGPLSRKDEHALDRAWSRITPDDIARSKERLQAIKATKQRKGNTVAVSTKPWDGSESRFTIEEWKRSTLIDTGEGDPNTKARYKLPVREPDGTLNANAVRNALSRISQVDAPADAKKRAMNKLQALKKQAGIGQ